MGLTSWFYLILAAVFEALYGITLFHSKGFTQLWPSIAAVVAGIATTILLAMAMKGLPVGLSFVVWSGMAAMGTAIYGMVAMGEPHNLMRLLMMFLILAGIAGLKFTSAH